MLERALEGGLRLVASELGDGAGRHVRCLERVGSDRHANVGEQVAGRTAEALLKMANEGGARHVAALSKLGQGPSTRRLVEHVADRGCAPRIPAWGEHPG